MRLQPEPQTYLSYCLWDISTWYFKSSISKMEFLILHLPHTSPQAPAETPLSRVFYLSKGNHSIPSHQPGSYPRLFAPSYSPYPVGLSV